MSYYESYFDEDLDDALVEAYDDASEDYGEMDEDYGESRADRRRRRQERREARQQRRQARRAVRRGGSRPTGNPPSTGAVQNAFENVGDDISSLEKKVKKTELKQSDEQMMDLLSLFLFRPSLYTAKLPDTIDLLDENGNKLVDASGNPIRTVGYKFEDNLLPLLVVKLLSNMGGRTPKSGIERFLPLIAALLISPNALKNIGIGTGTGQSSSSSPTATSTLGDLTKNPLLILLILFLFMKK